MKKLLPFLFLLFIGVSCSESEEDIILGSSDIASRSKPVNPRLDPTKLAKVIFSPGQLTEMHWFFYPNGLIRKITRPNGSLIQTFTYSPNQNLISTTGFMNGPGTSTFVHNFNYDATNHITSVDGEPVNYDAVNNKYIFYYTPNEQPGEFYEYPDRREIALTNDLLVTDDSVHFLSSDGDYWHGNMFAGYSNNNMTYVENYYDPSGPSYIYDSNPNPLKLALLPFCKAMSLTSGSFRNRWAVGANNSANNVLFNNYDAEDPEKEAFLYQYNSNNLPVSIVKKFYYNGVLENTFLYALYYYQGDMIPNN